MEQESPQFTDNELLDRLAQADSETIRHFLTDYKPGVAETLAELGASPTDISVFFKTALVELGQMTRSGNVDSIPELVRFLPSLCIAHYKTWKQQQEPETEIDWPIQEMDLEAALPQDELLQETRNKVFVWNQLRQMESDQDEALSAWVNANEEEQAELREPDWGVIGMMLHQDEKPNNEWPEWIWSSIKDTEGRAIWETGIQEEQGLRDEKVPPSKTNRLIRNIAIGVIGAIILYSVISRWMQPKVPAEVFEDNFAPPKSLLTDAAARYESEADNDSIMNLRKRCAELLYEADRYYQDGNYGDAQDPLLMMTDDPNSVCQSDGYFYLGIIRLEMEDPGMALQCFAKISDIEAYGEDIYWYQALCFVKIAEFNPNMRDKAARAVERFISNTRDEKRRELAEDMLKDLSD